MSLNLLCKNKKLQITQICTTKYHKNRMVWREIGKLPYCIKLLYIYLHNRYDKSWSQIQKIIIFHRKLCKLWTMLLFLCILYLCILQCLLDHQVFLVFFCHLGELLLLQILSSLENTHIITYTLWYNSATIIVLTNGQASTLKTTTKNNKKLTKKKTTITQSKHTKIIHRNAKKLLASM